jgi:hypothetical protein
VSINTAYGRNTLLAFSGFRLANSSTYSPVNTTVILGTARLNFGTRTHFLGHGTLNICRVNAKLMVRGPKILSGPRPPQEVVSASLKMGPRAKNLLRTRFVSHAFCFSHCKNIVSVQTNIEGKCAWSDEAIYKSSDIYYGHA